MEQHYKLTDTELELMEVFWNEEKQFSFKELMNYSNDILQKNWKKQTLSTYLKNLQKEGMIGVYKRNSKYFYYYPLVTRDEFMQMWTRELMVQSFGNSLSNFIAAFTGGNKLSKEEAEELKKYL